MARNNKLVADLPKKEGAVDMPEWQRKIREHVTKISLNDEQWRQFKERLDNPPKPNQALIELIKK